MAYTLEIQQYSFPEFRIALFAPNEAELKADFQKNTGADCPYWGRVWSSAKGLSLFLTENSALIQNKKILEIAGGLGLPSFVAARYATEVCCTDYVPEAISSVRKTIANYGITNVSARVADWHQLPEDLHPDVVLISDINYEPQLFDQLFQTIKNLLAKNSTIILSTPQRLLAKTFISRILTYAIAHSEYHLSDKENEEDWIHIFVLAQTK